MNKHRKKRKEQAARPATAKAKEDSSVVHGSKGGVPAERKGPRIQSGDAHEEDRLTTDERKRRFARNLDRLISLIGLSRKEVADEIGIAHKLVLRLVSTGVSRTDERNIESLTKIAAHFALPSVDDLWRADLLRWLLSAKDGGFVDKFRPRLLAERERRLAEIQTGGEDELALLSRALGFENAVPPLTGPWADKVAAILASPKAGQFKQLIDDYFQIALAASSVAERNERS
jgi:hypothetical protein